MAGKRSRRTVAQAKPITRSQVKGYDYVPNPGVRTLVAVNGRGAYPYRRRPRPTTAREAMAGLPKPAKFRRARRATVAELRQPVRTGVSEMKRNARTRVRRAGARKPSPAQLRARKAFAKMARNRKGTAKRSMRRNAKPRSYSKGWEATFGKKTAVKKSRPARKTKASTSRYKHGRKLTKAERAAISRRNLAKARAARRKASGTRTTTRRRSPTRRRATKALVANRKTTRRASTKRRAPARRPMRRNGRQTAAQRRASLANLRKARAGRKSTRRSARLRSTSRRRPMRRNASRQTAAQRRASLANLRKARAASKGRKSMRRNARRRSYRRNGYRKNGLMNMLKVGGYITGGLVGHKLAMAMLDAYVLSPMFAPAPAAPDDQSVSGLPTSAQPLVSNIVSVLLGLGGAYLTKNVVKDKTDQDLIIGGIAAAVVHKGLVTVLGMFMPPAAGFLSGMDDSTAARLSAMYGLGASTQPMYAPIGMGEYFESGVGEYYENQVSGLGEYYQSMSGPLGEYFESGVEGLGNYGSNPDLFEAAAGYGAVGFREANSNNIDPASDLDHQLTIAEAAAGIGASPYEAAAGYGDIYEAAAGFGNITTTPRASTWIPGEANPQLFAGVRAVRRGQESTAMVPAGTLQTPGGAGIFG